MAYRREIVSLRKPDGTACGAAIWQERNGQVEIDVKCTQSMSGGTLDVVLVEKSCVQKVGACHPRRGSGSIAVRTAQGVGVALCTEGGYIAAAGFLRGCTLNFAVLQARVHAAFRKPGDERHEQAGRKTEDAPITKEGQAQQGQATQECKAQNRREEENALQPTASLTGRRALIWKEDECVAQLWRADAWPPLPLAPGAAYKDGVFHLSPNASQDFVTGMKTV